MDWVKVSVGELLKEYTTILEELKRREVIRSTNNPAADLAEKLAAASLGLTLAGSSTKGHDGLCVEGKRWQVKGRRLTPSNPSRELGVVRDLESAHFDYLVAIYFDADFEINSAYKIDHSLVCSHANYKKSLKGHVLIVSPSVRQDSRCVDITLEVRAAAKRLYAPPA